jgi:sigma-B regulation protein RsbU (phosphoserine phosphatase)
MKIRIGRLEIAFGVVLAIYLILAFTGTAGWVRLLGKFALGLLGFALAVRISKAVVSEMLWRLRNRLIVAYFFIAVVPLILITLLAGLGIALIGGQISIFLVTSELERRNGGMRASMEFLAREDIPDRAWAVPFLRSRYPGMELAIRDKGAWRDSQGANVPGPPADWPVGSGLLVRDRKLYSWALASHDGRSIMGLVPVTREFLGQLASDIGEVTILNLESNEVLLHPPLDENAASRNRVPPAANALDFTIWWVAPVLANVWDAPNTTQTEWLNIRTRPSAVLRTVLSQKVDFANEMIPAFFFGVAILFLIAEAIAFMIGVSLTRTITGAVHELYEGTVRVMKGDLKHRIPPSGEDQLGELSVSFNNMTSNMERLLAIEKERERLQTELEIAREVQNQLYPKHLPDVDSLRLTAVCNPARMVSGDYYDYQQIGKDVAIAIGDVAGKGISAALLMATVQSSFRAQLRGSLEIAATAGTEGVSVTVSTSRVVSHLNQQLFADTAPEKYATFFLGVYDTGSKSITYTNAGHLPPMLIRNGEVTLLDVNGMVVGAFPFAKYGESRVQLQPCDLLVFYTDGITEPENAYGEMFGEERLIELLVRNADKDEADLVTAVTDAVRQWTGTDELQDDMTLLLVRQL